MTTPPDGIIIHPDNAKIGDVVYVRTVWLTVKGITDDLFWGNGWSVKKEFVHRVVRPL